MKRKTEAWLIQLEDQRRFAVLLPFKPGEPYGATFVKHVTPLVRRDPKAEAVVRAAEQLVRWWEEMGTACNPGSLNADPADRMMGAVHALLASRKRKKHLTPKK